MEKKNIMIAAIPLLLFGCFEKKDKTADTTNPTASETTIYSIPTDTFGTETEDVNKSKNIAIIPSLSNDNPVVMNDRMRMEWSAPQWDPSEIMDEEGSIFYDINIEADGRFLQTLHKVLPGTPIIREEVGRLVLLDLNNDASSDLLICLGRYGEREELLFDAWIWKHGQGKLVFVDEFRSIPSPSFNTKSYHIISGANEWEISKEKLKKIKK